VAILADRYGSTIEAIVAANGLSDNYLIGVGQVLVIPVRLPAPATPTPTGTPAVVILTATPSGPVPALGTGNTYVVRPVATLAQLNGIVNVDRIQVGQMLQLPSTPEQPPAATSTPAPPPTTNQPQAYYIVRPGDSLYRISLIYGVPIAQLAQANNIVNMHRIYVGQTLIIP
jgi:LysM repeat protein